MNLDPGLTKLLNAQINDEMAAGYSYLAISAWFEQTPYAGFANWMDQQSAEETTHAHRFYQFLVSHDEQIEEKNSVGDIVERLTLAGDDPASLLALDRDAGPPVWGQIIRIFRQRPQQNAPHVPRGADLLLALRTPTPMTHEKMAQ